MNETRTGGYAHPDRKNYRADEGGYSLGEHNLLPLHYNLTVRYACLVPTTAIILQVTVIVPLSEVMLTQWFARVQYWHLSPSIGCVRDESERTTKCP